MDNDRNREAGSAPGPAYAGQEHDQEYQFLNQTIRKKPVDRRAIALRSLSIIFGAVLFGIIAALFFVMSVRLAGGIPGFVAEDPKISIPADEEPQNAQHDAAFGEEAAVSAPEDADGEMPPSAEQEAADYPPSADLPVLAELQETPVSQIAELQETETEGLSPDIFQDVSIMSGQSDLPDETDKDVAWSEAESGGADGDAETAAEPMLSLQAYRTLFRDMLTVADGPEHAIVRVTGISSEMDFFNQNYENTNQISGLAVAENDESLFVLTEYRVVENVERIMVTFYDGTMADANFQKRDPNTGLAILKVMLDSLPEATRENLRTAPLGNSNTASRGEPVLALGSPLGYPDSVAYGVLTSVTNIVSGIDAQYQLLTTDIEGSRIGSGILVNLDGRVIGIIAQQYSAADNHTVTALAISQLKPLIEKLSNNETLVWLGVTGQSVTQELADRTGIPKGVLVTSVEQDSPAMLAGIKEYDVVTRINNTAVTGVQEYQRIVSALKPEEPVEITAMRKGAEGYSEISFSAECGSR